ncbi:purine-nucleoside phosphorylase [Lachnospiraceae bacterium OttesenSCG-928-D06]|nr:purine-nucleoside phosphorylase [Lachnospiraceae bacterium OttesenSCG-928-D06]
MGTPHIQAKIGEIAKTVLMPGDPLRAKFIAETFLDHPRLVNEVRNMYAFTGTYKGHEMTVMASGMGMPSMGIYSYELYKEYGVEQIIRIGSAGAYTADLELYDVVLADSVYSESTFAKTQNGYESDMIYPSEKLNDKILQAAVAANILVKPTRVHSTDVFYTEAHMPDFREIYQVHKCTCVDMESFALFHNANVLGKQGACLLTISDSFVTEKKTTAKERQTSFTNMMKIALDAGCI